jgi:hypothetical protein
MTDFINQLTINGDLNTFFNYVNPAEGGAIRVAGSSGWLNDVLTAAYGDNRNIWTPSVSAGYYNIRFPVPWETITGNVPNVGGTSLSAGMRGQISVRRDFYATNSTSTNGATQTPIGTDGQTDNDGNYSFGIFNSYSYSWFASSGTGRTGNFYFRHFGWAKDRQFVGSAYPRSLIGISYASNSGYFSAGRILLEDQNTTSPTANTRYFQNMPALSCQIATPGANAGDIILQDNVSPNFYIGKAWNLIRLPSSAVIGKIYKNTGVDPDTGNIETDQKRFYMCVAPWGPTDKIGMRVWTDNIT